LQQQNLHNKEKELIIPGKTENLSRIRDFVKETTLEIGFSEETIGNLQLAVDEWCTNIIKYAYRKSGNNIVITINWNTTKCYISIVDYGPPFDPQNVPEPDLEEYYRQHRVGGFGIHLMKTLMDEVQYTSIPGKHNQVLLTKHLKLGD
jgi:serine/threonine-protein kinase RsbW